MSACDGDILQIMSWEDIPKLRDLYADHIPYATHVYSLLNAALKWKQKRPDKNYFTFYSPNGDWSSDGTFVALMQFSSYDLFVFTLDRQCTRLYEALSKTKLIDFWNNRTFFYSVLDDHFKTVMKALEIQNVPVSFVFQANIQWMPKEKAKDLFVECPPDFQISTLKSEHAKVINDVWPHRFENSEEYLKTYIEMNGGHGIFRKSDEKLVAWVLKSPMGNLAILQTSDEFKNMGFGSKVTKSLSKEIALEGHNPLGTVGVQNDVSNKMFRKIGFGVLAQCYYIGSGKCEEAVHFPNSK